MYIYSSSWFYVTVVNASMYFVNKHHVISVDIIVTEHTLHD